MKNLPLNNYNKIANQYDSLFTDKYSLKENEFVISILISNGNLRGNILDIGCGTGLLIDCANINSNEYTGIDPSENMLNIAKLKHKEYNFVCEKMENTEIKKYNSLVSLFGSVSYVNYDCLKRIKDYLVPNGKYFLMFFGYNYKPITYIKTGVYMEHNNYSIDLLKELFDEVFIFNDYYIAFN